jgi:hypothetical protein|tara:strand:+ start:809 stop:1048 length:240 start_codon:yes stop_codon:yes gene_type:complete
MSNVSVIKEDGYYLKIIMDRDVINNLPKHILHETPLAEYMVLGNEEEISIIENILGERISGNYCFDWFLIYEKGKNNEF